MKMKCLNCGAKVKKSEEICPECGAYISTETKPYTPPSQPENEEEINLEILEKAEEAVRNIDESKSEEYNFSDYLILPSLVRIGGGLFILAIVIFSFTLSAMNNEATMIIALLISAFSIFNGIASAVQESKCKLTVNDEKVYGTIPQGTFDTETIDINIEDIIGINESGFHSKNSHPKVYIVTKEKEYTVKGSSKIMLGDLSENLQNKVRKLKGESE